MSGFTSGKVSHDPQPWVSQTSERHRVSDENGRPSSVERYRWFYEYAPRPEFDNHNPILVDLREYWAHHGPNLTARHAAGYLDVCDITRFDATPEQIAHARRVLSKLAALA